MRICLFAVVQWIAAITWICSGTATAAQQDVNAGDFSFTIPEGWQLTAGVAQTQGRVLVLPGGPGGQPKAVIMVFRDAEIRASFKDDFSQAIATAGQNRKPRQTGELLSAKAPGGNALLSQSILYDDGGYVSFLAAQFDQRMVMVLCLTGDPQVFQQIVKTQYELVAGLKPAAAAAPAPIAAANGESGPPSAKVDEGRFRGSGICGVWMGFTTLMGSHEPSPRWVTFFDDGQAYRDIPREGLRGFNRAASKADKEQIPYWGSYSFRDDAGQIALASGNNVRISSLKPDQIKLDSTNYYRCADVDGLRLAGTWATGTRDATLKLQPGQRPCFHFQKDGTFIDEGVFSWFLKNYRETISGDGGSGTYQIKDFTLTLRYSDGRVRNVAFTGMMSADPAKDDKIVFISRAAFSKW